MDPTRVMDGLFWFVAFLFSTTVHEAAHAWVALRGGDRTAYLGGQVSLSPIPHLRREPIGMLVVPLLTAISNGWAMGWASAPYDPYWAERHPRRAAWMAAAGPAANFCLAILAFVLMRAGLASGYFAAPPSANLSHVIAPAQGGAGTLAAFLAQGLSVLLMENVILGTFNLVPLPPLDGSAAVGLILPEKAASRLRQLARAPQFSLIGLVVAMVIFPRFASPLFGLVLKLVHPGMSYS
ncbi:MAG TPA: site-2 protease family protein [Candidatus Polarisedimenticolia bacterium]|jgi:Zn-dependent protease|nr:site-2 protease family protein [Candidatus Polarisedimenticolia bacterium]